MNTWIYLDSDKLNKKILPIIIIHLLQKNRVNLTKL